MTDGAIFWFIVGGASAAVFFGIALVVTIRGAGELRELMGGATRKEKSKRLP
jgi:hypothetical protein